MTPATVRLAGADDSAFIEALINRAYEVEAPFMEGPRISEAEVRALMADGRMFLMAEIEGRPAGCVMVRVNEGRGYMGLLAVDPVHQRSGLGSCLLNHVEVVVRASGSTCLDILVINLRHELLHYYARRGFRESGAEPYVYPRPQRQPFHFVRMTKTLQASDSSIQHS